MNLPAPALPGQVVTVGGSASALSAQRWGSRKGWILVRLSACPVAGSWQTGGVPHLRDALQVARLYLVCGEQSDAFLEQALRGGVDIIQLRLKDADRWIPTAIELRTQRIDLVLLQCG